MCGSHCIRPVYREDLQALKKSLSKRDKEASAGEGIRSRDSAASEGRRTALPTHSLTMDFIHG